MFSSAANTTSAKKVDSTKRRSGVSDKKPPMSTNTKLALAGLVVLLLAVVGVVIWLILRTFSNVLTLTSQGGSCRQKCQGKTSCNPNGPGTTIAFKGLPVISYPGDTILARGSSVPVGSNLVLATVFRNAQGRWMANSLLLPNTALGGATMAAVTIDGVPAIAAGTAVAGVAVGIRHTAHPAGTTGAVHRIAAVTTRAPVCVFIIVELGADTAHPTCPA